MFDEKILETLRCPATGSPLSASARAEIERLNDAIAQGHAWHADGTSVRKPLDSALAAPDGVSIYAIREGVPELLPELRIVTTPPEPRPAGAAIGAASNGILRVWDDWAVRWHKIQPPARPVPDDLALFERFVSACRAESGSRPPRALLLGVTPEIVTMRWPAGTRLLALDLSEAMIRNVWPRETSRNAVVARANWRSMPVADAAYDLAIGDGVLLWQKYPDDALALAAEVRRVLQEAGALVMRLFAKPDTDESIEAVVDDLRRGRIPNSAALHLRVGMALHRDVRSGLRLGDAYDVWHAAVPDEETLLASLGWPPEQIGTFEVYRGLDTTVAYPTVAELTGLFAPHFRLTECRLPGYDARGMFPVLMFRATK